MELGRPNLFVVGAPKCGTTTLHNALADSPAVFMSRVKETGFFINDHEYCRGLAHYSRAYFRNSEHFPLRGESTPWYLYSPAAQERLKDYAYGASVGGGRDVVFVILLREPATRALSMHGDQVRQGRESRSFAEAVQMEIRALNGGAREADLRKRYVEGGLFYHHLARWFAIFEPASTCVLWLGDLERHPNEIWSGLGAFLNYDLGRERITLVGDPGRNQAGGVRSPFVQKLANYLVDNDSAPKRLARQIVPRSVQRSALSLAADWNRKPQPRGGRLLAGDVDSLELLEEFYAYDQANLMNLVRDLRVGIGPQWS